jgi:hypothetical protein
MGALLATLATLAAPMTARVLIALGFSVVTVTGVSVAWSAVLDQVQSSVGSMPGAISQLIGLGGGWIALGAVLGAVSFVVSLWTLTAATRIIGVGS